MVCCCYPCLKDVHLKTNIYKHYLSFYKNKGECFISCFQCNLQNNSWTFLVSMTNMDPLGFRLSEKFFHEWGLLDRAKTKKIKNIITGSLYERAKYVSQCFVYFNFLYNPSRLYEIILDNEFLCIKCIIIFLISLMQSWQWNCP